MLALVFSPFGVYSVGIAAITAAIAKARKRIRIRLTLAGSCRCRHFLFARRLFGSAITGMMAALPVKSDPDAGRLALLSTIGGSLYQALQDERERDAAVVAFLVTAKRIDAGRDWFCVLGSIAGGVC
ncbi:benzoate/H(+) symporter BenE family transporter [Escherichia coli]